MSLDPAMLDNVVSELETLRADLDVIGKTLQDRSKNDKSDEVAETEDSAFKINTSSSLLQPTTRLRKDIKSAKYAQDNPEMQKIIDRLNDIFR